MKDFIWGKKTVANPRRKIHCRKHRDVGLQKGKYYDPLRDVQKKQPGKVLILVDSENSKSDGI